MPRGTKRVGRASTLLLLVVAGCAHGPHDRPGGCGPLAVDVPPVFVAPLGARGDVAPDLTRLASFTDLDEALKQERATRATYRKVSARDCQCLAVQGSSLGDLLDKKSNACVEQCPQGHFRGKVSESTLVQQALLRDAALEARNRSAGTALALFFRLAESEGKLDVLKQSLGEIENALETGERMKAKGMQLGDDFEILRRRRVSALDGNIELELAIVRLNAELRYLLKLGPDDDSWRIWPDLDWQVVADPLDVTAAVALGLERRPELVLLRRLAASLDRENAPLVRGVLGQAHALLGMSCQANTSPSKILLSLLSSPQATDQEVEALCRQVQTYRIEREQDVAQEIRQDVMTVNARLRQIAVAREEVQGWERRLDELKAKAERGMSTFPERTTIQLRRLEAQSVLIEKVVAWHTARVTLSQDQGLLIDGCGPSACLIAPVPGIAP